MVDTPKKNNNDEHDATEDNPVGQKPKQQRMRHSKSRHSKSSDNSARRIDTPDNSKGNTDHMDPAMEQDEPGHAEHSLEHTADHSYPEGRTHQPASGEEHSPDNDAFIIPKNVWNKITSAEG